MKNYWEKFKPHAKKIPALATVEIGPPNLASSNNISVVVLEQIIPYALGITFILATLSLIIGGFLYITAGTNPKFVERAKTIISTSIIGLIIVILSYVIVATVNMVIGGGT
ncbi:hypothetical protein ACFL2D_01895 [Patescibacteria group bacterium]